MISYICASHNPAILFDNLLPSLDLHDGDDELIVIEDPKSIAEAYNEGTRLATRPIRCFVQHDIQVLNSAGLREELIRHCTSDVGIVGAIGSRDIALPWWVGEGVGSVEDGRLGLINFGLGGEPCSYLDGILLATVQPFEWDEGYTGFHLYDHDVCQSMLTRGLTNFCLASAHTLIKHNTRGMFNNWDQPMARFEAKWGITAPVA